MQILVRAIDGLVARVAPDDHVWGNKEGAPVFVVLHVAGDPSPAIEAQRSAIGRVYVELNRLGQPETQELADNASAAVNINALGFGPDEKFSSKLCGLKPGLGEGPTAAFFQAVKGRVPPDPGGQGGLGASAVKRGG